MYNGGILLQNNKLLAALCYFSVFFAPLLLPVIIYFITDDREIKFHAKRSLVSHLVPVVLLIAGFVIFTFSMFSFTNRISGIPGEDFGFGFWQFTPFLFTLIYGLLFIIIVIWNLIQGVKVLR
jgi:predicted Co/Zn/Cd cation transporter (cation efflux family)